MKTMIERWEDKATSKVGQEDDERYGVQFCLNELSDACTPRPPKPEWFGTGPGQWDSWWFAYEEGGAAMTLKHVELHATNDGGYYLKFGRDNWSHEVWLDAIAVVVPVAREGFPAPVGWHVVGG